MEHHYQLIPTWDNGEWTTTEFETQEDFKQFLLPLFKEPGTCEFDETSLMFNPNARAFNELGRFCEHKEGSLDHIKFWDKEKAKCRFGVIYKSKGKTWYLTRDYYMWINFLRINIKDKNKFDFPSVWDSHYYTALYELLAELHNLHAAIVKKRQYGSSYFHIAKIVNLLWFEESPVMKIGASIKSHTENSWGFMEEYKSFLNQETAWYRPMSPEQSLNWKQQIQQFDEKGRGSFVGNKGIVKGLSFEKKPTSGIGGALRLFFYEEAGEAPTMDKTVQYLYPAMAMGKFTTGLFIASGSVGELKDCGPLKKMIYNPTGNKIYPVTSKLLDDKGTVGQTGLFIPEQWSMPPYIDKYGNSLVEEALADLNETFALAKKTMQSESDYQLYVSQHPRNIAEAFDYRETSIFPLHLVKQQEKKIEEKEYSLEYIDLKRGLDGKIEVETTNKYPITEFPISKKTEDKTGVIVIHERPIKNSKWGTYLASIDPVSVGKSTTSESLCSIYVYKTSVNVERIKEDGSKETFVEGDKIVAWWTGRFDDIAKTHERLELIIEYYNATTIVENNVSQFIQYMVDKNKQRFLAHKNQMLFLKEIKNGDNGYQEYGWRNVSTVFKDHVLPYFISYLKEVIDVKETDNGIVLKEYYGIERIPDIMVMKEMIGYGDGVNVDRIVAIAALIAFATIQKSNRGAMTREENTDEDLEKRRKMYNLNTSAFRHIGNSQSNGMQTIVKSSYKNMK